MTKITFLGTGSARVTDRYNTCFIVEQEDHSLLVDCGGGHEILRQFKENDINIEKIDAIFISHSHADHLLGFPFLFREMILSKKKMKILCSQQVRKIVQELVAFDLGEKAKAHLHLLLFQEIDIEQKYLHYEFFPVEERQYGFILHANQKISFTGDCPVTVHTINRIKRCDMLIQEAFCSESGKIKMTGHHSTIEEAIKIFRKVKAKKMIIIHSMEELQQFSSDRIKIAQDGEVIWY